jgi:hypothetical protein
MQSLSIAPIFAPWSQEKPSYAVRDSDSGNMHFWPERRAQTGAQAGAGWLHNARVGLQPREDGYSQSASASAGGSQIWAQGMN